MKTLQLKVLHRLLLRGAVDLYAKGGHPLSDLKKMMKILEAIEMKEDEQKKIGLKIDGTKITWDTAKDKDKAFEFEDDAIEMLKTIFKSMNDKKEFTLENMSLGDVAKQLELNL